MLTCLISFLMITEKVIMSLSLYCAISCSRNDIEHPVLANDLQPIVNNSDKVANLAQT